MGGFRFESVVDGLLFSFEGLLGAVEGFRGCGELGLTAFSSLGGSFGGFFLRPSEDDLALVACGRTAEADALRGVSEPRLVVLSCFVGVELWIFLMGVLFEGCMSLSIVIMNESR